MSKLQLTLAPTFKAKVDIPVPGAKPVKVEFTFKGRTREELAAWLEQLEGKEADAAFMEIVTGWDLEDAFEPANVKLLLSNYIGTWAAVYAKYLNELVPAREKN